MVKNFLKLTMKMFSASYDPPTLSLCVCRHWDVDFASLRLSCCLAPISISPSKQ